LERGDIKGKLPSRSMPGAGYRRQCLTVQTTSYPAARLFFHLLE